VIRRFHIKTILVGFLAMVLSVIALAVILVVYLVISKREIAIGPMYLLIPSGTFATGCYWSVRRSCRSKTPAKPSSNVTIIAKSAIMGVAAVIVSLTAYVVWIWLRIPQNLHGLVSIDVRRLVHWPVLLVAFLAGFILEYRHALRRRSMLTGGMAQ
jgi:hypothetical protein